MGYSPRGHKELDMNRTSLLPLFDSREDQGLGKVSGVVEGKTRARIFPSRLSAQVLSNCLLCKPFFFRFSLPRVKSGTLE